MSEHPIGTAKPCCMFLELASIASGPPLEDAEEDERTSEEEGEEEEDAAAASEEPQMLRPWGCLGFGHMMSSTCLPLALDT